MFDRGVRVSIHGRCHGVGFVISSVRSEFLYWFHGRHKVEGYCVDWYRVDGDEVWCFGIYIVSYVTICHKPRNSMNLEKQCQKPDCNGECWC